MAFESCMGFFYIRDQENDRAVEEVLASKGKQQKELISGLLEDEKYQRDAFSALLIKQVGILCAIFFNEGF